jgi:hypothetical protein
MEEHFFQCPYCWEDISVLLDPSAGRQEIIEDCEVCCNPLEIHAEFESGILLNFEVRDLGQ